MSKTGKPGEGTPKPAPPKGNEPGMAVIRKQRRSSLERALRGGRNAEPDRPDAAAAWGSVLQRDARKGRKDSTPEPAEPKKGPAPRSIGSETLPPDVEPEDEGFLEATPPPEPKKELPAQPSAERPRRPRENDLAFKPDRAPSTAMPETGPQDLDRMGAKLASDHEQHERRSTFRTFSVAGGLRIIAAVALVVAATWLALGPPLRTVGLAERQRDLHAALTEAVTRLEGDPRLATALQARDLPVLREIFLAQRASVVATLQQARFPAHDETVRIRLVDAGRAVALSADFEQPDGEVIAATQRTGKRAPPPHVPALFDVLLEEHLLEGAALALGALAGVFFLIGLPLLRRRA